MRKMRKHMQIYYVFSCCQQIFGHVIFHMLFLQGAFVLFFEMYTKNPKNKQRVGSIPFKDISSKKYETNALLILTPKYERKYTFNSDLSQFEPSLFKGDGSFWNWLYRRDNRMLNRALQGPANGPIPVEFTKVFFQLTSCQQQFFSFFFFLFLYAQLIFIDNVC